MSLIALDYDDTFTADPVFWRAFIELAQAGGHKVIIATLRENNYGNPKEINDALGVGHLVPIVFCNHRYKDEMCRKAGYTVDIWIDDMPEAVRERYTQT